MQFVQEHPVLNINELEQSLNAINVPFQPSQVYNAQSDTKLVKPELRLSEFRTLDDSKLFEEADKLISYINSKQSGKKFILHKNDIMHIRYKGGGYFKPHEDYLSVTSNFLEEYSLIICIKGSGNQLDGGRTILKLNDFFTTKSTASCIGYAMTPSSHSYASNDIGRLFLIN